jgi:hypothetical protein
LAVCAAKQFTDIGTRFKKFIHSMMDNLLLSPNAALLTAADSLRLLKLKEQFSGLGYRYCRGRTVAVFGEAIQMVRRFCEHEDGDDRDDVDGNRKRMVACGLLWFGADTIAVNIQRLQWLMSKSKSTLNDDLTKLSYRNVKPNEPDRLMLRLAVRDAELKRWSFRQREVATLEFKCSDDDGLNWCTYELDSDN